MLGIAEFLDTNTNDYDNWCGIREMGKYIWRALDGRTMQKEKKKLSLKSIWKIQAERAEEIEQCQLLENKKYKRVFGNIYIKI